MLQFHARTPLEVTSVFQPVTFNICELFRMRGAPSNPFAFLLFNRASQSVVSNIGQKMALRAFYHIRALTKALTYYYINRSQRHLLVAIEKNRLGGPIHTTV